jgi:hypothetical protein
MRSFPSSLRLVSSLLAASALVVLGLASAGCPASACPFPNTSAVTIDPPQPCLDTKLDSCIRPSLRIVNKCKDALYMPIDYGVFAADAMAGSEIEVLTNATITYEVREDKATKKTASREDYEIPARLGSEKITFRFDTTSN